MGVVILDPSLYSNILQCDVCGLCQKAKRGDSHAILLCLTPESSAISDFRSEMGWLADSCAIQASIVLLRNARFPMAMRERPATAFG